MSHSKSVRFCPFLLLAALTALPTASAQSTIQLPTQLPGAEALDMELNPPSPGSARSTFFEQGLVCEKNQTFTYENAAQTSAALNQWVTKQGLTATTIFNESGFLRWVATTPDGMEGVGATFQGSYDSSGGMLYLCAGPIETEETLAREYSESRRETRPRGLIAWGLGLGALLGLGLAGLTKLINDQQAKRQAKLDEQSAARWNDDNWQGR